MSCCDFLSFLEISNSFWRILPLAVFELLRLFCFLSGESLLPSRMVNLFFNLPTASEPPSPAVAIVREAFVLFRLSLVVPPLVLSVIISSTDLLLLVTVSSSVVVSAMNDDFLQSGIKQQHNFLKRYLIGWFEQKVNIISFSYFHFKMIPSSVISE